MKFLSILGLIAGILGAIVFIKEPGPELALCTVIGFGFFFGWGIRNKAVHGKF